MTFIVAECPERGGLEVRTDVDQQSRRFEGIKDAHWLLVREHANATGHAAKMRVETDE